MTVFVTGASGFLGQAVVAAFAAKGHGVRALVRSQARPFVTWGSNVSVVVGDLRALDAVKESLRGVDAVIHLAAGTSGSLDEQLPTSVVGTERLLAAMLDTGVKRLVLASTFSVYDWSGYHRSMTEESPLERRLYERDGYAVAKTWQERIVQEHAGRNGWDLTVLRPGFIWGRGRQWVSGAGMIAGNRVFVNGPFRRLPLTHVANCADCFVAVTQSSAAVGQTFNVVDTDAVRAWRFARDYVHHDGHGLHRLAFPYLAGLGVAHCGSLVARCLFGRNYKLPGILLPIRYRARFKSSRFPNTKLRTLVGWAPPLDYAACLQATYGHDGEIAASATTANHD